FFYVVPPLKVFDIVNLSWRAEKCLFIKIYVDFVQKLEHMLYLICVDGLDRLNIDHAPKLQSLLFVGSLKYICLKNTPSLSHVTISLSQLPDMNENLWNNGGSISLINNLDCLSNLKSIVAGFYSLKFLAECRARKRLPSTFIHLRSIYISMLMFEDVDSLSCVVGLITSSPNLHKLVVTTCTNSAAEMETATEYLEGESRSIGGLMKLRYVVMKQISGLGPEMELMKLILAKSPSLKQMKIEPDKTVDISSESRILKDLVSIDQIIDSDENCHSARKLKSYTWILMRRNLLTFSLYSTLFSIPKLVFHGRFYYQRVSEEIVPMRKTPQLSNVLLPLFENLFLYLLICFLQEFEALQTYLVYDLDGVGYKKATAESFPQAHSDRISFSRPCLLAHQTFFPCKICSPAIMIAVSN
ncbi:hypothetical protein QQP08_007269, partial [Theobroma cacao]